MLDIYHVKQQQTTIYGFSMSTTIFAFKKRVNTGIIIFAKRFVINLLFLQTWEFFTYLPIVRPIEGAGTFDIPCIVDDNCSTITGATMCDNTTGMCLCAEGNIRMRDYHHCVQFAEIGEDCQIDEQCKHSDQNVMCNTWSQRCRCKPGYEHRGSNNTRLCLKSPHTENEPYIVHIFSGLDPVHIVLGCLTGGLALLACFAGIIQLVRKKYRRHRCDGRASSEFSPDLGYSTTSAPSQSHPFSDSQYTTTSPSGGDFACLNGNSTAPPTPGTLPDEEYVVTPPPTYEEAIKSDREKAGSAITV